MRRSRSVPPRPHPALRQSTAFAMRFGADRMRKCVAEALAEELRTWCEYATLKVVCAIPGLSQIGLAERTAIDRTRTAEALERLEDHGLVARDSTRDRRRLVYATDSGPVELEILAEAVEAAERAALLPLTPRERARVGQLLAKAIPPDRGIFGF